ncbi:CoA-binding protein [Candidatus Woesearchaeota archaeon]|nr:CoA-binding protein [Candidatus Woesearchaeota archaeon]
MPKLELKQPKQNVAIIGASRDRRKYGNKAVRAYASKGYEVYPVNPNTQQIEELACYPKLKDVPVKLDIVSVYVPSSVGLTLVEDIVRANPKTVYLNPGAESPELIKALKAKGLRPTMACSILAIGLDPAKL